MLPDYDEIHKYFKLYIADNCKNVCAGFHEILDNNLFEAFEECKFRINYDDYHDCEIVAISHSTSTQIIKQFKFYTDNLMFLTIRPSDEMPLYDFKKLVNKLLSKDIITSYIGVWEQKGISYSTLGQGKHIHILLKFNYNQAMKSHRQQIKDFLKKNGVIFDIGKTALRKLYIIDKIYYMGLIVDEDYLIDYNPNLKYKKTKDKIKCLQFDRIFVERNKLEILQQDTFNILKLINNNTLYTFNKNNEYLDDSD